MPKTYRSHKDIISKAVLKEVDLIIIENQKNLKFRQKHHLNTEKFEEELLSLEYLGLINNPRKAIKILDTIKFAFEWGLYSSDENWTRRIMITKECKKLGVDVNDFYSWNNDKILSPKIHDIILKIDRKLLKKQKKGLEYFAKYFSSFDLIKL